MPESEWVNMAGFPDNPQSGDPLSDRDVVLASLADSEPQGSPRRRTWVRRLVILGAVALVLGPLLYALVPAEISRWYEASAIEKHLDGDAEGAIEDLGQALRWNPENWSAHRHRITWRIDEGDYLGALEDCNRALELGTDSEIYRQRGRVFQHLGRHQEAIADWRDLDKIHENHSASQRATTLNDLAYAQAVGVHAGAVERAELEEALENVQRALDTEGDNPAMLDTRGFIYYLQDDLEAAESDMDAAVTEMEEYLAKAEEVNQIADGRGFEMQLKTVRQSVAVIRYHRALVRDKLGETDRAERDRRRVRELGYEPNEKLF